MASSLPVPRPLARPHSYPEVITHHQLPRFNSHRSSLPRSFPAEDEGASTAGQSTKDAGKQSVQPETLASADALMANGQHEMNRNLMAVIEDALGAPMPSMDVRFRDVSIRASFMIYPSTWGNRVQVPTLLSPLKKAIQRLLSRQQVVHKEILKGVTGVFRPGRVALVLGHPGSGKSSLMKILSGRFPLSKSVEFSGEITYNDMPRDRILNRLARFVGYADANDEHYGKMTVDETFKFAHACCAGKEIPDWLVRVLSSNDSESQDQAIDVINAHHRLAPDIVAKRLGLEAVKHVRVGDPMVQGLSPTDKKRVTIGEMAFGMKVVQIVDQISSGLNGQAKFEIVDSLRSIAVDLKRTVVVAMSQPTPAVFDMFDDVLVLNDGYTIYHGPRSEVLTYFQSLGFDCPPRKDVSDFLLEMGTPRQQVYKNASFDFVPMTPAEFASTFQQSAIHHATLQYLDTPHQYLEGTYIPSSDEMKPFRQSFLQDLSLLLRRHWLLTTRNKALIISRSIMVLLMGALYGTTFWQFLDTSSQLVLGLLFSCSMFLSLGQAAQLKVFMSNRAVFYKQRSANFFRTSSYVLASCMANLPLALLETVLYGSFIYWMGGYVAHVDRFLTFLVTLFLCQICFTSFFFLLSSAVPNISVAQFVMIVSVLVFTLFGGFLVIKNNIPSGLIWLYWMNPVAWCIRALSVNQYTAPRYKVCTYKGMDYCKTYGSRSMSQYILSTFDLEDDTKWIYYTWVVFGASYLSFCFLSYLLLEHKRFETPEDTVAISVDVKSVKKQLKRQHSVEVGASLYKKEEPEETADGYVLTKTPLASSTDISQCDGVLNGVAAVDLRPVKELLFVMPREGCCGFVPVTLAFRDLWFSVPAPGDNPGEETDLLRDVSGFALPGTMTALMGAHGAGKSTLLEVISGRRTTGKLRGDIFLNGYPATDAALRRCAGYCDRLDVHSDAATVREAMQFAAMMRQDSTISSIEKYAYVEECIDLLDLRPIANRIVRGSSREQMKRLTIAVEMAACPGLLFVDDPTHGLGARSSMVVMNSLRKIADTGRTVICSVHQSTTDVFNTFDSALVLQRGGQLVFFGPIGDQAAQLIKYFEQVPGVPPLKAGYNPVSWMLETLGSQINRPRRLSADTGHSTATAVDFAAHFETSDQCLMLDEDLDQEGLTRPSQYLPEIKAEEIRAVPPATQFSLLLKRFIRLHWRTPTYNLTRLVLSVILSAAFGVMYQDTNYKVFRGVNSGVGLIFLSTFFFGIIAFSSTLPIAAAERAAFYRERSTQTYTTLWYFSASTLAEIPFVVLSGLLFTCILFPLVGFEGHANFVFYWLVISLHLLMQVYMGQCLVYLLPSVQGALAIGGLLNSVFLLFAGFNPPTYKIPDVYKWLHYASPPSYTISALGSRVLAHCSTPGGADIGCQVMQKAPARFAGATVEMYMATAYKMKHSTMWRDVAIMYAITVGFRVVALLSLRFISYRKK